MVPATGHVRVRVRIEAIDADTLGTRMEQPAAIPPEAMQAAQGGAWWQTIEATLGEAPKEWELWTNAAEEGLLRSLGITRPGAAYHGGPARNKDRRSAAPKMDNTGSAILVPQCQG